MDRRMPPLNALRVFEAAARHLSFTKAAAELNVTQAAVSHQIKALEAHLGLALFRRLPRALRLTEAGQVYLPTIHDALERIARATADLGRDDATGPLKVSTLPSFAARWLVMRLQRFQHLHPDIDVLLTTTRDLVDFSRDDIDVAIRFGLGHWPGLASRFVLREEVFPVCSPALMEGTPSLRRPEDLAHQTLLHDDYLVTWDAWLAIAGVTGVDAQRGPRFTDSALVLQAAVNGQGVALARGVLAADDLDAGRLVRPFAFSVPGDFAYFLVAPDRSFQRPKVAAFSAWVLTEACAPDAPPGPSSSSQ